MHCTVSSLRIHKGVIGVPVDNSYTVVLVVATGHQLHVLPAAGELLLGICLSDGLVKFVFLTGMFSSCVDFFSAAIEACAEG
jgi:hypothetical protein